MAGVLLANPAAKHLQAPPISINSWEKITKKNGEKAAISSLLHPKLAEAYKKAFNKLLCEREGKYTYASELDACAKKKGYSSGSGLLTLAISQLGSGELLADSSGRITNARELGGALSDVLGFLKKKVSLWVFVDESQLSSSDFPLSKSHRQEFSEIIRSSGNGEAAILMMVKSPPLPVAEEVERLREEKYGGLSSQLGEKNRGNYGEIMDGQLAGYFDFATIRVLSTGGKESKANQAARRLNNELELSGGAEESHAARVAISLFENGKNETLWRALRVCTLVIAAISALNRFAPGVKHLFGGVADDFFGSFISGVSQSWNKAGSFWQNARRAAPVLLCGLAGMLVSLSLAFSSTLIYSDGASAGQRVAGGAAFALACCSGTLGTTVGAVVKAYNEISSMKDTLHEKLGAFGKVKEAIREAVLRIPFRLGNTMIGVPMQLLLGLAAGAFCFFQSGIFIVAEGMLETAAGVLTAFLYPKVADSLHMRKLKQL